MRHKVFALILALTVASWAQTAIQTAPPSSPAPEKSKASCCDKMSVKDGAACQRHKDAKDSKEIASCCAGKDAAAKCCKDGKSCMKDDKMAASCCKDGCGKDKTSSSCCKKGCCSSDKKDTTAKSCCAKTARG